MAVASTSKQTFVIADLAITHVLVAMSVSVESASSPVSEDKPTVEVTVQTFRQTPKTAGAVAKLVSKDRVVWRESVKVAVQRASICAARPASS